MKKFYCPTCNNELEELNACGSVSFFCDTCKVLVSRSKMLTEEELELEVKKEEQK